MKKKRKKHFFKTKFSFIAGILMSFLTIFVLLVFLGNHLLQIQVPERLRYIKDYKDFTLVVDEILDCDNQVIPLMQRDDVIFNGICIRNIFVKYGRTKAPLKLVLDEGYITLQDITKKMNHVVDTEEKVSYYEYRRSNEENGNYRVTISPRNYQGNTLTEVTFERYVENQEVLVSGSLDIK